jgi:signal peptidase I
LAEERSAIQKNGQGSVFRDYGGTIIFAVMIALLIRFFVIEAYRIPSSAMRPTLEPGDTIFVEKWPFGLRLPWLDHTLTQGEIPKRGEVVVFSSEGEQRRDYIKRVVGLPGDNVEIKRGSFILNGHPTEVLGSQKANCGEEKTPGDRIYSVCWESSKAEDFAPIKVPAGSIFVAGDLRSGAPSNTSKEKLQENAEQNFGSWGIVPLSSLRGRALWIWLSVDPQNHGSSTGLFPSFRFDRMFRSVQ